MMHALQVIVVFMALGSGLVLPSGCASRQQDVVMMEEPMPIERPAEPLEDEESFADKVGQVGVVILLLGVTVGLALLPFLLL